MLKKSFKYAIPYYPIMLLGLSSNYLDKTIYDQYNKLNSLGFDKIYLYPGGLFEWLLLQETFGCDMFETNYTEKDILKYRPK